MISADEAYERQLVANRQLLARIERELDAAIVASRNPLCVLCKIDAGIPLSVQQGIRELYERGNWTVAFESVQIDPSGSRGVCITLTARSKAQ